MATKLSTRTCEVCKREGIAAYDVAFGVQKAEFKIVDKLIEQVNNPEYKEYAICITDIAFINKLRKKFPNAMIQELVDSAIKHRLSNPVRKMK